MKGSMMFLVGAAVMYFGKPMIDKAISGMKNAGGGAAAAAYARSYYGRGYY